MVLANINRLKRLCTSLFHLRLLKMAIRKNIQMTNAAKYLLPKVFGAMKYDIYIYKQKYNV